jgi:tetratricopeptide (TPR) repeat protein
VQDEELAQHSFFNLGNAAYNGQDLETAVQSYIDALLLNPNDADAKYNLELALQQQTAGTTAGRAGTTRARGAAGRQRERRRRAKRRTAGTEL